MSPLECERHANHGAARGAGKTSESDSELGGVPQSKGLKCMISKSLLVRYADVSTMIAYSAMVSPGNADLSSRGRRGVFCVRGLGSVGSHRHARLRRSREAASRLWQDEDGAYFNGHVKFGQSDSSAISSDLHMSASALPRKEIPNHGLNVIWVPTR